MFYEQANDNNMPDLRLWRRSVRISGPHERLRNTRGCRDHFKINLRADQLDCGISISDFDKILWGRGALFNN